MAQCRRCPARIFFALQNPTASNPRPSNNPINWEPSPLGNLRLDRRTMRYDVLTGQTLIEARAAGEQLYLSHFADCPGRKKFRRTTSKPADPAERPEFANPVQPTFEEAQAALRSEVCPCGKPKGRGLSFCGACYTLLPESLRRELYRPPLAYHVTVGAALRHLRAAASRDALVRSGAMTREEVEKP